MAVLHGEQRLQPGDPRLHSVTRTAFRVGVGGKYLPEDGGGGAAARLRSQKRNKKDFVGPGSGRFGWCKRPLGKALPAQVLVALEDLRGGVLLAQSSPHILVGVLGEGKRASRPLLPWARVGNTNIISQRAPGIFPLALE